MEQSTCKLQMTSSYELPQPPHYPSSVIGLGQLKQSSNTLIS